MGGPCQDLAGGSQGDLQGKASNSLGGRAPSYPRGRGRVSHHAGPWCNLQVGPMRCHGKHLLRDGRTQRAIDAYGTSADTQLMDG